MTRRVLFVHPDLGIGGAERAIVDMAMALQKSGGFETCLLTAHHDETRCFVETKQQTGSGGSLRVSCVGDWLPRSIFGRAIALCAYLRMIYISIYAVLFLNFKPDVVIVDQVSACIPIFTLFSYRVIFYCHFPDLLLSVNRQSFVKRLYRGPIDWLEECTTAKANVVVVNSKFTAGVVRSTFKNSFGDNTRQLEVLYPVPSDLVGNLLGSTTESTTPDYRNLPECVISFIKQHHLSKPSSTNESATAATTVFVSLNRFERKKAHCRAIKALAELHRLHPNSVNSTWLVIAGGYDRRLVENVEYYDELVQLANQLNLSNRIIFIQNVSADDKIKLLKNANCVIYTPENEHFGMVPIEAMAAGCPVIACTSGGPLETIIDGKTGYLCEPTAIAFAAAMSHFLPPPPPLIIDNNIPSSSTADWLGYRNEMTIACRKHVRDNFSPKKFQTSLISLIDFASGTVQYPVQSSK